MSDLEGIRRMYVTLAERCAERGESRLRDVFYVLAADVASAADQPAEAEAFRRKVLQHSPSHPLKNFPDFAAALKAMDFQDYVADLRNQFPPERAQQMLELPREMPTVKGSAETLPASGAPLTAEPHLPGPHPIPPAAPKVASSPSFQIPLPGEREGEAIPHRWIATLLAAAVAVCGAWTAYLALLRPLWRG